MRQHQYLNDGLVITPFRPGWLLVGLVLFGIGFGFVEAVVVVDLRAILSPSAGRGDPLSADELFPFTPLDHLEQADPVAARLMKIEVFREGATLVLLAGVGLAAGRTFLQRFSAFLVAFAIWDLSYYLSLRLLLGWPATIWTWDILFLIPIPWAAPVLAPALVATTMALAGSTVLVWESSGRPFRVSFWDWTAIVLGGLILIASFCRDWRNIAAGGLPNPFPWPLFLAGEVIALAGFFHAARASGRESGQGASRGSTRDRTGAGQGSGGGIRRGLIQAEEREQVGDLLG